MGAGRMGNKHTCINRGEARNEASRISAAAVAAAAGAASMEQVAPLEVSANRWVAGSTRRGGPVEQQDTPEMVDRKVRALLNKLTMEKFEPIPDQIITWANRSENETDGHTLIWLVQERAAYEVTWSEMNVRLCRKMIHKMAQMFRTAAMRLRNELNAFVSQICLVKIRMSTEGCAAYTVIM